MIDLIAETERLVLIGMCHAGEKRDACDHCQARIAHVERVRAAAATERERAAAATMELHDARREIERLRPLVETLAAMVRRAAREVTPRLRDGLLEDLARELRDAGVDEAGER